MRQVRLLVVLMAVMVTACGGPTGEIDVSDARIGQPTGPNAALYLTATSDVDDRLISAETDIASSVQIHETVLDDHGMTGMQPVDSLEVMTGETLVLEPGGPHLMLMDAERLEVGDEVEVTLIWESAGEQAVVAEVVAPEDAVGHSSDG